MPLLRHSRARGSPYQAVQRLCLLGSVLESCDMLNMLNLTFENLGEENKTLLKHDPSSMLRYAFLVITFWIQKKASILQHAAIEGGQATQLNGTQ